MKQVSVALCGGLGNQCFQFLTLLAYAMKTNRTVVINDESSGMRKEVYWRTVFSALIDKKVSLPSIDLVYDDHEYLQKTKTFVPLREQQFSHSCLAELTGLDVMLCGYFQSHLYFQEIEHFIPSIFALKTIRREHLEGVWQGIVSASHNVDTSHFVSMHVRRGDYLNYPQIHPTLSVDYYTTAMSLFPKDTVFVVFSDDMEWCRKTWGGANTNNILFVPQNLSDIDSFHLMMFYCLSGHIIANSSFSWWAAYVDWLISRKERIVVAPETWFGPNGPQKHSLHVPGWLVVQNH